MKPTTHPRYIQPITGRYEAVDPIHVDQEILQRVTGLISLGANLINIVIIMRFLLDLLDASHFNPFARLIFTTSEPFLAMFQGLTHYVNPALEQFQQNVKISVAASDCHHWNLPLRNSMPTDSVRKRSSSPKAIASKDPSCWLAEKPALISVPSMNVSTAAAAVNPTGNFLFCCP
jgi:hypothetical protein